MYNTMQKELAKLHTEGNVTTKMITEMATKLMSSSVALNTSISQIEYNKNSSKNAGKSATIEGESVEVSKESAVEA